MSDTFVVTGGAGFIGSNIIKALNHRGITNIIVVDKFKDHPEHQTLNGLEFESCVDLNDFRRDILANKIEPVKAFIHMGACSSTTETNEEYLKDNNFAYTRDMCKWCVAHGTRFVYASSAATYGDGSLGYSDDDKVTPTLKPLNLYGESKQMFDVWALENGMLDRIAGIKFFNVYGPREEHKGDMRSLVNKAYTQVLNTSEMCLFKSYRPEYEDGKQERDFVYVRDAVNVSLYFADHPEISGIFNCGTGTARTWIDLANAVFAAMGKESNIKFVDMPESIKDKYQYHTMAEVSKLNTTGYTQPFTSIEDGVREYVQSHLSLHQ